MVSHSVDNNTLTVVLERVDEHGSEHPRSLSFFGTCGHNSGWGYTDYPDGIGLWAVG